MRMSTSTIRKWSKTFFAAVMAVVIAGAGLVPGGGNKAYAASLQILQTVTGNIFKESDVKSFGIATDGDAIDWSYSDYWGNTVASGSQPVANGETTLTLNTSKYGWFKLTVAAKLNGAVVASKETSFAVVSDFDLSQVEDSPFSVQTHAARTDVIAQDSAALVPIAAKLGVKYVRDSLRWEDIEDSGVKGVYSFKPFHDSFMTRLDANHLKPYMTLALYNSLYDNGLVPNSPEARLAFANYGKQLLARYPQVRQVEVWNEPDIPSFGKGLTTEEEKADFYFNLLKTSYEHIHPAFPDVKIIGFVFGEAGSDQFLESLYQKGSLNYMDEYSFHSYARNPEAIVQEIERHRNIMKKYNNGQTIPMNLSETGFTNFNFDEYVQANYIARRVVTALANGIPKINIYNLQNKSTVPQEFEGTFGLVRHPDDEKGAYVPKPAYSAYAAMIRELTGASFVKSEDIAPGFVYSYRFAKNNDELRVMYSLTGTEVKLFTDTAIRVTDMMGNMQTHTPVDGAVRLQLGKDPVYVKGTLKAPFFEEIVPVPTGPIALYHGYYANGGYTETNGPLGTATNKWVTSSVLKGYDGKGSRAITNPTGASATWKPAVSVPGRYRVTTYLPGNPASPANTTRSANYSVYVGGVKVNTINVNQWTLQGTWVDLGVYDLPRSTGNYIVLEDGSELHDKPLRADVVKFELIPPSGIALEPASLQLAVGDSHSLTAAFTPGDTTDRRLVWSSSNSAVATVDTDGRVSAAGVGTAVIRAASPLTGVYAEAAVEVKGTPVIQPVTLYSNQSTLGYTEVNGTLGTATNKWVTSTVLKGYNGGISRAVTHPTGASAKWTPSIAQSGRYRVSVYLPGDPASPAYTTKNAHYSIYIDSAKADTVVLDQMALQGTWQLLGSYDLPEGSSSYVLLEDGNPLHDRPLRADTAKFELIPLTGVSLGAQTLTLEDGTLHLLSAELTPADATDRKLVWSSSNDAVAAVDDRGELRALAAGSAVIRATNPLTSLYSEVSVTVTPKKTAAAQVVIDRANVALHPGETAVLSAQVLPADAADKTVTWSTYNSSVAVVDQNGLVTALQPGRTTIRAASVTENVYAESLVTVTERTIGVSSIVLDKQEMTLRIGEKGTVTANVYPLEAADRRVQWSSSSEAIAVVDQQGQITAIAEGTAYVRAQSVADAVYGAVLKVTVLPQPVVNPPAPGEGSGGPVEAPKEPVKGPATEVDGDTIRINALPDQATGAVKVALDKELLQKAKELAISGNGKLPEWKFDIAPVDGAASYRIAIPKPFLTADSSEHVIRIRTAFAEIDLPSNMVQASGVQDYEMLEIVIEPVDPSLLSPYVQSAAAGRPVIDLRLLGGGRIELSWSNRSAAVGVSIPYSIAEAEKRDEEKLSVWYVDETQEPTYMVNARYNEQKRTVQFSTTHFSKYAVVLTSKTFTDLIEHEWARNAVEVLASRGVIQGTSEQTFSPAANVIRADFIVLLTRALELQAVDEAPFADVRRGEYYAEAAGIAHKLGIAYGVEDGRFDPSAPVARQDMLVMIARALKAVGANKSGMQAGIAESYSDFRDIAEYARSGVDELLGAGLVEGSDNKLNPRAFTTRAEAAVLLYRLQRHMANQ